MSSRIPKRPPLENPIHSSVPAVQPQNNWVNSPTVLKIRSFIYKTISLAAKPFNSSISDYYHYRASQVKTKIYMSSSFIQKEFGKNMERSGISITPTKTYEEFKNSRTTETKPLNTFRSRISSINTSNEKLNNLAERIKNIQIPEITVSKALYSCKLLGMAACRLGWPLYHLYFKICEFPGRVGSLCMNIGNVKEAKSDKDLKAANQLYEKLKSSDLLEPIENSDLEGRNLQGVCMGTVLNLFTEYHKEENEKNFNSFEKLSNYSSGAPADAVANQIIYENMVLSQNGKKAAALMIRKNGISLPENIEEKTKAVQPFFRHEKERALYEARGLNLEFCKEFPGIPDQKNDEELFANLSKLNPGTYYLGFSMGGLSHAMGYIKHPDGTAHIFDPNKGTIRCYSNPEDHVKQLKKAINCYAPSTEKNSQLNGTNHQIEIKKAAPLN